MSIAVRLFRSCAHIPKVVGKRGIAMSSPNLQKALEKLEKNPYYEKYAQRIAELQKTSPEEFIQRVETFEKAKEPKNKPLETPDTRQFSSVLNPKQSREGTPSAAEEKKLSDILKLELVQDKDASEIQIIWEEYHKNKDVICATIPEEQYTTLYKNTKSFPTFLFPLPRSQGYEFIMCQCYGHSVHFTPLLAFQVHKENAPECLTMNHYTELRDKGIVLMRGEFDKNVLNSQEAQCLANQFQMYYSGRDSAKYEIMKSFTEKPDSFKHMDLIKQLESISLV